MPAASQVFPSVSSDNRSRIVFPKLTQPPTSPPTSLKPIALAVIAALTLNGCATTNPKTGQPTSIEETFKQTFASDDPCANNARNIGMVAGALLGAVIGNKIAGGNNKASGTMVGLGLGSALGAFIGSEVDKRQCELSKIQKKYGLDMQVTPIAVGATSAQATGSEATNSTPAQGSVSGTQQDESATTQKIGLSVSVVDREGKPQFVSGSDELQPDAKEQFSEISRQYAADYVVAGMGAKNNEEKQRMSDELRKKRVLLIGHTDDTGSSKLNADLSERRAKSVAKIFKSMGVAADQLFYQGAGETLPIADNATAEGRAKNRRVEIVDLSNEETFKLYLQNRRPNTNYYRPADATGNTMKMANSTEVDAASAATKPAPGKKPKKQKVTKETKAEQMASVSEPAPNQPKLAPDFIDFGGSPFTPANGTVNLGEMAKAKQGFMLISEAHASNMRSISSCNMDRPRSAGAVKSFKDGKTYTTSEYLPGLYGRSWQDTVSGNLVVLNGVAVLRDGAAPANAPDLKVYANYNPSQNRNPKPDVAMTPSVNTYQGSNGLLYRVFIEGEHGMQCMDVLMPADGSPAAKAGKVIYGSKGSEFVSDFKPVMIR